MNAEQRLAELLETVETPTNKPVTISDLADLLSDHDFALVRLTLESATVAEVPEEATPEQSMIMRATALKMQDALAALRSSTGLLLSSPERQSMIDQLAAAGEWPDEVKISEESRRAYIED